MSDRDWAAYYDSEWEDNTCSLCTRWLKRFPGSDERILSLTDYRQFLRTLSNYRPNPADQDALRKEWRRRARERRELRGASGNTHMAQAVSVHGPPNSRAAHSGQ